jgi:exopolysaccharide biosynthesis polyprenyl glycosylphosphotransferase
MTVRTEERLIVLLYFVADMCCYAAGLRLASFAVLDNLPYLDLLVLHRDRLACMIVFGICALLAGAYDARRITDHFDTVYYVLLALGAALVIELAVFTLLPEGSRVISRRELLASIPVTAVLLAAWRYAAAGPVRGFQSMRRRFYVLGEETEARRIAQAINENRELGGEAEYTTLIDLHDRLAARLRGRLFARVHEEAIIAAGAQARHEAAETLVFCGEHFDRVYLYPGIEDLLLFNQWRMQAIAGIPLVEVAGIRPSHAYVYVKRWLDIACALAGLIVALPLCIPIAIAVKLSSPGPVLYSQMRLGRGGRAFKIYKFRTMRSDIQLRDEAGHVLAQENDPRITRVGRFLRQHRLDEIPQLVNVLLGDMSLIGPRPVWKEFYDAQRPTLPLFDLRLLVRPGLTSLSHVLGSYSSEPRDRLRYDLVYISSLSFLVDLKIMLETVRIVLSGKGAQ